MAISVAIQNALSDDSRYQALLARDKRFDGVFFVAVKTTRIYCRPICTVKPPLRKNVMFFKHAAMAEANGFRPCLRCRPELAPGCSRVDAVDRLAYRVGRLIEDGALNALSVNELAETVEVSERHLRRVVERAFGVGPIELAQTQRLLMAKRLLADTDMPITEVAFASGFSSLRRFNAALKDHYGLSPTQMRGRKSRESATCSFFLSYRPPYDWHSLIQFLGTRAAAGVENVRNDCYSRTVQINESIGWISVSNAEDRNALRLELSPSLIREVVPLLNRVKDLFDLDAEPDAINRHLGGLSAGCPGLRVPGAFDGFEIAVRAILGQQVSVKGATTLMARLMQRFGRGVETPDESLTLLFPPPGVLAAASVEDLMKIGIPRGRALTLSSISAGVACGDLVLRPGVDVEDTIDKLKRIKGIGDWTSQYIAMRTFGWPDAFPAGDLGIKKALGVNNERSVLQLAEKWRPWRAYATMHLWRSL